MSDTDSDSEANRHASPAAPGARLSRSSMADILQQERNQAASQVRRTQVIKFQTEHAPVHRHLLLVCWGCYVACTRPTDTFYLFAGDGMWHTQRTVPQGLACP